MLFLRALLLSKELIYVFAGVSPNQVGQTFREEKLLLLLVERLGIFFFEEDVDMICVIHVQILIISLA